MHNVIAAEIFFRAAKNGFELQDSDIELLHFVYDLRIATIDHLAALSGRSVRALWGRLLKLKERRYLAYVARFMQKQVYGVGSKAAPVLIEHGYAPQDLANRRLPAGPPLLTQPLCGLPRRQTDALRLISSNRSTARTRPLNSALLPHSQLHSGILAQGRTFS